MISKCIKLTGNPVIFFRSFGWNNSTDIEKINESMEVYKAQLPLDIYTLLFESEFSFVEIDDVDEALEFCEDNFPESIDKCEKEFYIHYTIFNSEGQVITNN
jgi:hypothetical protein